MKKEVWKYGDDIYIFINDFISVSVVTDSNVIPFSVSSCMCVAVAYVPTKEPTNEPTKASDRLDFIQNDCNIFDECHDFYDIDSEFRERSTQDKEFKNGQPLMVEH